MDVPKNYQKVEKTSPVKEAEKAEKEEDRSNWSHDIENRDYYYDDSTGYEVYDPDQEEADGSDTENAEIEGNQE